MPRRKAPKKLYDLCCTCMSNMIEIACLKIWNTSGCYENHSTIPSISQLRDVLTSNIAVSVLDHVLNMRKSDLLLRFSHISHVDVRILFGAIMHEHMTIFKILSVDIPNTLISKIDQDFWMSCLSKMNHLVVLDLSLVCTDEILRVVGQSCKVLQEVTVVSKMSRSSKGSSFNALKKIYHVSDQGLLYLTACQKLKQISLTASHRSGLGNITEQGICMLVCSLPNLRFINYEYMGSVLKHLPRQSPSLVLQRLRDLRCNSENVAMFNRLCPDIVVLNLSIPTNLTRQECEEQSKVIIDTLVTSCFKLQVLYLRFLIATNVILLPLLAAKGGLLTSLSFGRGCSNFDTGTLMLIGHYCINLKELTISTMGPDFEIIKLQKRCSIFESLLFLSLNGNAEWKVETSLSLCLSGGNVSELCVCGPRVTLDNILVELLTCGRLGRLTSLVVDQHCVVSRDAIWTLLENCPRIAKIHGLYNSDMTREDTELLRNYISANNFDVEIKFSEANGPRLIY